MITKKDLLRELKKAKLPSSYTFLLKLERLGIVQKPVGLKFSDNVEAWRVYTEEEVDDILTLVREYKDTVKSGRPKKAIMIVSEVNGGAPVQVIENKTL